MTTFFGCAVVAVVVPTLAAAVVAVADVVPTFVIWCWGWVVSTPELVVP